MKTGFAALVTIMLVAALGFGLYLAPAFPAGAGTISSSTTSTCTTSATTSLGSSGSNGISGSFEAPPGAQVRVDYVRATVTPDQSGGKMVSFVVGYTNLGPGTIYVIKGCGSSLNATVTSGSGVIQTTGGSPRCLCAEAPSPVAPGSNSTAGTPGCWSGYTFTVVHPGTVTVRLVLAWSQSFQFGEPSNETIIATFNIS